MRHPRDHPSSGRFLEHARIYYFRNGGQEEYYIGSADCMKRNLEHRVEAVAPVESKRLQKRLREILDIQCNDRRSAWDMQSDGEYVQRTPCKNEAALGSQDQLILLAEKRAMKAQTAISTAKRKRRSPGPAGGELWNSYWKDRPTEIRFLLSLPQRFTVRSGKPRTIGARFLTPSTGGCTRPVKG